MSPGRLEAFSDGVIAIAITLLSLEIRLPDDDALTSGLLSIWPSYVGFVLSFLLIGQVWLNHHAIFQKIRYVDQWVLVCNLLLLLDVAFLPFATTVLTRALKTGEDARIGAVFYGMVMVVGGLFFNGLWRAAIRNRRCLKPEVPDDVVRAMTRRFAMGPLLYAIAAAECGHLPPPHRPLHGGKQLASECGGRGWRGSGAATACRWRAGLGVVGVVGVVGVGAVISGR